MAPHMWRGKKHSKQSGIALISVLLLLMLMSALAVGLFYKVNSEQLAQKTDSGNTMAYYGAEAGMEKLTTDLNSLFAQQAAPSWCDIQGLTSSYPDVSDVQVTYANYAISASTPITGCAYPPSQTRTITTGPNAGLIAHIVPLSLQVTADRPGGEEVSMIRQVEIAEIPVFQFGIFSDSDLSYFPGPDFDFAGRVQTNGNLFLASDNSVTFHTKIRAAGDVVRDKMANGASTSGQGRNGKIYIPTTTAGCDGSKPACRNLQLSPVEGSSVGGPTPTYGGTGTVNSGWTSLSTSTYNNMILSGSTGATRLNMAFVQTGVNPIEILRRPLPGESASSALGLSRLYNEAQIRVLLSDDPADLPGGASDGQNIRLANVKTNPSAPDYTAGIPVSGVGNTYFAEASTASGSTETGWTSVPNMGAQATIYPTTSNPKPPAITNKTWNLLDGYLRVEVRRSDGTYVPVTKEWLELGFARGTTPPKYGVANSVDPKAILILQQPADRNGDGVFTPPSQTCTTKKKKTTCTTDPGETATSSRNDWYPINIYDSREGELRENQHSSTTCNVGGIINVTEIDLGNLRKWLQGTIGTTGTQVEYTSQNGYVLYFSDRRGMKPNASGIKIGEYGFEDVINPASSSGTPNNSLDNGEDVNGNGVLDTYGAADLGYGFGGGTGSVTASVNCMDVARKNWVSGARHAVRLVDGSLGSIPTRGDNDAGGFTLASENPAYIWGDYNARGGFGDPHASASVIADTVTLLSNNWSDLADFNSPTDVNGRPATTTYYRVAIASGKNRNFPLPTFAGAPADFGTDGGVHNFLRYLENWGGDTSNYLGSMVSLYYSMYDTGVYKCCGTVYAAPTRNYAFDSDFLDISKMPPGTPTFRDVDNLGFQRVF